MNRNNLDRLIRHLEKMPDRAFDMSQWLRTGAGFGSVTYSRTTARELLELQEAADAEKHPCGTAGCIAGYAHIMAVADGDRAALDWMDSQGVAREYLDLTASQAEALFIPDSLYTKHNDGNWYTSWYGQQRARGEVLAGDVPSHSVVTRRRALQVLYHLRDTGTVDWRVVKWPVRFAKFKNAKPDPETAIGGDEPLLGVDRCR